MKSFLRESPEGKVLLIHVRGKKEICQASFDSWEMARRMFPNIKAEKVKPEKKDDPKN